MKTRVGLYLWTVLLIGTLAIGAACTKAIADGDVTTEVQKKLTADSGLQGKELTVQTSGGVVTLSGSVENEAQRTAASRYASSVSGVKEVVPGEKTSNVKFVADKAGIFPIKCQLHPAHVVGQLVVLE